MSDSPSKPNWKRYPQALSFIMAGMLAVALTPALAFAGQQELAAGGVSETPSVQGTAQLSPQASKKALAKKTKTMRAKYKAVLKNARLGKGSFNKAYRNAGSSAHWGVYDYALYDVDKNGTPELFVFAGTCSADTKWYVFTIKSGKAKCLGKFGDGNTSLSSGKGRAVYGRSGHMGVERVYLGKISNGKIKSRIALTDTSELQGFPKAKRYATSHKLKMLPFSSGAYDYSLIDKARVTK